MRFLFVALLIAGSAAWADCVILLHGLARSDASLLILEETLEARGYDVVLPSYPSTSRSVESLAEGVMPAALQACQRQKIHLVTHSMGAILVRYWFAKRWQPANLGHVVMLAPPNQGSELVDALGDLTVFGWINGPAGGQLGTGVDSLPRRLPPVTYSTGVVAGNQSLNPFYSTLLPGPDDGKVSVTATRVEGMRAQVILPVTHTFMMNNPTVLAQVVHYLETGMFEPGLSWVDVFGGDAGIEINADD